jgi:YebC/PmpR family DNA-binding regulatory protein
MATKMANDAKKGKIYSKYGRLITIAVKDGGGSGDPEKNSKLKTVMEQANNVNMPKENVERAIKRGTGELAGESLEEFSYEGFGPAGIAVIVNGIADNKNRTLGEIKSIFNQNNGKMAGEGAIRWMFDKKGVITVPLQEKTKEELELLAIELGADDVSWHDSTLDVYTKPEDLEKIKKALEEKQIKIDSASIDFVAKEEVVLSEKEKEQTQKLFEALDENDAVNDIYSNIKN